MPTIPPYVPPKLSPCEWGWVFQMLEGFRRNLPPGGSYQVSLRMDGVDLKSAPRIFAEAIFLQRREEVSRAVEERAKSGMWPEVLPEVRFLLEARISEALAFASGQVATAIQMGWPLQPPPAIAHPESKPWVWPTADAQAALRSLLLGAWDECFVHFWMAENLARHTYCPPESPKKYRAYYDKWLVKVANGKFLPKWRNRKRS